jgi:crotonobetainyl-CoA:carnitine CoA-transferase CaiB-like acyl-CoA transferase
VLQPSENSPPDHDRLPLAGVRVLDWTRLLPGPWCSQMLSDLGAEVIKVEHRGVGDVSRHNAPSYRQDSVYFHGVNGGKKSLTIDLTAPRVSEVTRRLIETSDIMMESFSTSVAGKYGIDAAAALEVNPKLIHCAISGYGQTGPLSPVPGHDLIVQAATGLLAPGTTAAPRMPGFQTADYAAGLMACIGILAALRRRDRYGMGAALDIAMFDSMFNLGLLGLASALARASGASGEPAMEIWGGNPRYDLYATRDGKTIAVSLLELRYWRKFCEVIGRPDLAAEWEDPADRLSSHGALTETYRKTITDYCKAHDRDQIARAMAEHAIPVVPVLTPDEALASDHVAERNLLSRAAHRVEGPIVSLNNPLHTSGLVRKARGPAPAMGADNAEILSAIGFSAADIADLARSETI